MYINCDGSIGVRLGRRWPPSVFVSLASCRWHTHPRASSLPSERRVSLLRAGDVLAASAVWSFGTPIALRAPDLGHHGTVPVRAEYVDKEKSWIGGGCFNFGAGRIG